MKGFFVRESRHVKISWNRGIVLQFLRQQLRLLGIVDIGAITALLLRRSMPGIMHFRRPQMFT